MQPNHHFLKTLPLLGEKSLFTLVENRSAYTLENCELNVFETHQQASGVKLSFSDWVLTSMLRGKKVMHLPGVSAFDYFPGESVIVPPRELMKIDFPEASQQQPTQCIALAISAEHIASTLHLLNEQYPKVAAGHEWKVDERLFHLVNNNELADIVNRLMRISISEQSREKDLLANLALRELLVRLMQTQARQLFERNYQALSASHPFAYVIQYINEHLEEKIDVNKLSALACMSRASFFRKFKEEFGYTPADYVLQQRIKLAKKLLRNPRHSVTQVCFMAGFQSLHYFIRTFKKQEGLTPRAYLLAQQV